MHLGEFNQCSMRLNDFSNIKWYTNDFTALAQGTTVWVCVRWEKRKSWLRFWGMVVIHFFENSGFFRSHSNLWATNGFLASETHPWAVSEPIITYEKCLLSSQPRRRVIRITPVHYHYHGSIWRYFFKDQESEVIISVILNRFNFFLLFRFISNTFYLFSQQISQNFVSTIQCGSQLMLTSECEKCVDFRIFNLAKSKRNETKIRRSRKVAFLIKCHPHWSSVGKIYVATANAIIVTSQSQWTTVARANNR